MSMLRRTRLGARYVHARDAARRALNSVRLRGSDVYCSCCGTTATRFLGTERDLCFACGARGRHRLLWWYLRDRLRVGDVLLHVAPEPNVRRMLERLPGVGYLSVDLRSPHAHVHADLSAPEEVRARLGERTYSFILISHVLEHIPDDAAAMRALRSMLADDGEAVVQVPHDDARPTTYEDWSIATPEGRLRAFGQEDHVRIYGRDLTARLVSAGLRVQPIFPAALVSDGDVRRMGLDPADPLYICRRDDAPPDEAVERARERRPRAVPLAAGLVS